jgi:hypothetical protein
MPKKIYKGGENRKIKEWGPLVNSAYIQDEGNL